MRSSRSDYKKTYWPTHLCWWQAPSNDKGLTPGGHTASYIFLNTSRNENIAFNEITKSEHAMQAIWLFSTKPLESLSVFKTKHIAKTFSFPCSHTENWHQLTNVDAANEVRVEPQSERDPVCAKWAMLVCLSGVSMPILSLVAVESPHWQLPRLFFGQG